MKKILVHPDLKKQLQEEFKVSYVTVTMSIDGVFSSQKAIAIRERTKELLLAEVNKIEKNSKD
jgi:uncharacterized protein YggU (UPF0235/DUF167 family)